MTKKRNFFEILSILDRKGRAVTAVEITKELNALGIFICERAVRNYLKELDDNGFTDNLGKLGRRITDLGRDELRKTYIGSRTDFIYDKIRSIISDTQFDIDKGEGDIIVNISFIPTDKEKKALKIITDICNESEFAPPFISVANEGEIIGGQEVPKGKTGLATISSVTVDQIILNNGISVDPLYGVLMEFKNHKPIRCISLYSLKGSSDPLELFISTLVSTPYKAIMKKDGIIPVDYREVPHTTRNRVINILEKIANIIGGTMMIGRPGENTAGIKSREGYIGIIATGGELLLAALETHGIPTNTRTVDTSMDFNELEKISDKKGNILLL